MKLQTLLLRSLELFNLKLNSRFSNNITFMPFTKGKFHPVFTTHYKFLQKKMAFPIPGRTIHVINRNHSKLFPNYIAEVESLQSVAPREVAKDKVNLPKAVKFIEQELDSGRLKKIVFQSKNAYDLHGMWFTPKIKKHSTHITLVPPTINHQAIKTDKLRILIIATAPIIKGLFLLPEIIKKVRKKVDAEFICVTSKPLEMLNNVEGLEVRVIERMTPEVKRKTFKEVNLHLNISLGDTLGIFLDSIQFGVPMVTFSCQHGHSYVKDNKTGCVIPSPIYYYSEELGTTYKNKDEYEKYIIKLDKKGFFKKTINETANLIIELGMNEKKFKRIIQNHRKFAKEFKVSKWLKEWKELYHSI